MEMAFAPCTRMHDLMRAWNNDHDDDEHLIFDEDQDFEEVELRAGADDGAVDFSHLDLTSDNFWQFPRGKIVWMGPDIFVQALHNEELNANIWDICDWFQYNNLFSVRPTGLDADRYNAVKVYSSSVTDATTTVCDHVLQLMTRSTTTGWTYLGINALPSVSTDALSWFLENSRDSGGTIEVFGECLATLSQPQLRDYMSVFEDSTRPHHKILRCYKGWPQEQIVTVVDCLQRCQCAFELKCGFLVFPPLIIDAFRGNCNITELDLQSVTDIDELVRALAENKSLVHLSLCDTRISDDNWAVLCQSLSRHPKLESLRLVGTFPSGPDRNFSESNKTRRTGIFLKMLQTNTVLQELDATRCGGFGGWECDEFDESILVEVIQPYFRHLPHVRAFGRQNGGPTGMYAKVFALALNKVNDRPALTWMLIRGNIPTILGV